MGAGPATGAIVKPQNSPDTVAKIETKGNLPPNLAEGIMQQEKRGRGRPTKEGPVHRTTEWRRQKEAQEVLV